MSQKNFPSYGDMETLFTEIGEKLGEKQDKEFIGTQAEWDALSSAEKLAYKIVNITDDESETSTNKNLLLSAVTITESNTDYELNLNAELKDVNKLLISLATNINMTGSSLRYYPFIVYLNGTFPSYMDVNETRNNTTLKLFVRKISSKKISINMFNGTVHEKDQIIIDGVYFI